MSTNRVDVHIAVEHKNVEKTKQVFIDNKVTFGDDDFCSPFSDDDAVFVFYLGGVRQGDTDHETGLLLNHKIPFSLFHGAGSDFHYGWTHSRLQSDGEMSFIQYFGDGESVSLSEIQTLLNNASSLDDAKLEVDKLVLIQNYPEW
jgi:hypothetical protein